MNTSEHYTFAENLVWRATRKLNPNFNFDRLILYSNFYTNHLQTFVTGTYKTRFYSTFIPTAEVVLHSYKTVFQPIVRYHMEIGFDPLEVLILSTFLGFYCARLYFNGIKDAPDFAVDTIADALKFFEDTNQFGADGWQKLDVCAFQMNCLLIDTMSVMMETSKIGESIEQYLKVFLRGPLVPVAKNYTYINGFREIHQGTYADLIERESSAITGKSSAVGLNLSTGSCPATMVPGPSNVSHELATVDRNPFTIGYESANVVHNMSPVDRVSSTVGYNISPVDRKSSAEGNNISTSDHESFIDSKNMSIIDRVIYRSYLPNVGQNKPIVGQNKPSVSQNKPIVDREACTGSQHISIIDRVINRSLLSAENPTL